MRQSRAQVTVAFFPRSPERTVPDFLTTGDPSGKEGRATMGDRTQEGLPITNVGSNGSTTTDVRYNLSGITA